VSEIDLDANSRAGEPAVPASAGALLRAAREAAGITVDAIAQQLKLAPRQVQAIEDGDFPHLPGRTFVRGFIRNYARLLRLDPETVLEALPTAAATLGSPALQPTAPSIGELPTADRGKSGWTRWAIPMTLVAIIAAAALYESMRPGTDVRRGMVAREGPAADGRTAAKNPLPEIIGTPLQKPLATVPAPAVSPAKRETSDRPIAVTEVAAPSPRAAEPAPAPQFAVAATESSAPVVLTPKDSAMTVASTVPVASAVSAPSPTDAPLTLAFRDYSWTEIKDRRGHVLLSRINSGGTTQGIAGSPPLDLVIGNAADVTLTWRGKRIDLAPHTRQNVARLTLQ
jgi:cytoskeleton protein RodZ